MFCGMGRLPFLWATSWEFFSIVLVKSVVLLVARPKVGCG